MWVIRFQDCDGYEDYVVNTQSVAICSEISSAIFDDVVASTKHVVDSQRNSEETCVTY